MGKGNPVHDSLPSLSPKAACRACHPCHRYVTATVFRRASMSPFCHPPGFEPRNPANRRDRACPLSQWIFWTRVLLGATGSLPSLSPLSPACHRLSPGTFGWKNAACRACRPLSPVCHPFCDSRFCRDSARFFGMHRCHRFATRIRGERRSSIAANETFGYQPGPHARQQLRQDCLASQQPSTKPRSGSTPSTGSTPLAGHKIVRGKGALPVAQRTTSTPTSKASLCGAPAPWGSLGLRVLLHHAGRHLALQAGGLRALSQLLAVTVAAQRLEFARCPQRPAAPAQRGPARRRRPSARSRTARTCRPARQGLLPLRAGHLSFRLEQLQEVRQPGQPLAPVLLPQRLALAAQHLVLLQQLSLSPGTRNFRDGSFHLQPGERLSWEQEIFETDLSTSSPASASPGNKKFSEIFETDLSTSSPASASPGNKKFSRRIFPPPARRAPLLGTRKFSRRIFPPPAR